MGLRLSRRGDIIVPTPLGVLVPVTKRKTAVSVGVLTRMMSSRVRRVLLSVVLQSISPGIKSTVISKRGHLLGLRSLDVEI